MKNLSSHALAAKQIREELKKKFPNVKFNVRSDSFSGGDAVRVSWINALTCRQVEDVINKYQYGKFDGMTDCYNATNVRKDISQVKYATTDREITEDVYNLYFEEFKKTNSGWDKLSSIDESSADLLKNWDTWTARNYIYRKLANVDLTKKTGAN